MTWSRRSRHERGYGAAWERLRLVVLERDCYLCQCDECKASGRVREANQVDHIRPKADCGTDDFANLRAINRECHARKTLMDRGHKPRQRIGLDGYPTT